jgi:hypothetical protein
MMEEKKVAISGSDLHSIVALCCIDAMAEEGDDFLSFHHSENLERLLSRLGFDPALASQLTYEVSLGGRSMHQSFLNRYFQSAENAMAERKKRKADGTCDLSESEGESLIFIGRHLTAVYGSSLLALDRLLALILSDMELIE